MKELKGRIKGHEALRLKPYKCTGDALTIGWGHNLDAKGIPLEIAERLFELDFEEAEKDAEKFINSDLVWGSLIQTRKNVLIEMAFNLGLGRLRTFARLKTAIIKADYDQAAKEMLDSKWRKQVGRRAVFLSVEMATGRPSK